MTRLTTAAAASSSRLYKPGKTLGKKTREAVLALSSQRNCD
ncbi:MAG: hypothetical protein ACPHF4_00110 [Rubripirellula sp.]